VRGIAGIRARRLAAGLVTAGAAAAVVGLLVGAAHAGASAGGGYGPEPAPSLFGLNTGTYDHDISRLARDTPVAAAMGAQWVHFTGDSVTFSGDRVSFTRLDDAVDQARAYHLGVLVSLGGVPAACSLTPRPSDITKCPPTTAADLRAYSSYLTALLLNLRGRVDHFESWVEPNHASMWQPAPDAAAYARLLIAEYRTFQAVNRRYGTDDKLLFAGIGGSDLGYLGAVLDALGGQRAFDLVGDSPYRFPPTSPSTPNYALSFPGGGHPQLTWVQELTDYEGEFTSHGYGQPKMWLTEFGWPGIPPAAAAVRAAKAPCTDTADTQQDQAGFLQQAFAILRSSAVSFVQAAFWENERDYEADYPNPDPECFEDYGLLDTDFDAKPAGQEFEDIAGQAEAASNPAGPTPTLAADAAAAPVSGQILVEAPGTHQFVPLAGAHLILAGSTVDATAGVVRITIETRSGTTQSAIFYGGRFRLELSPSGAARLILDAPLDCPAGGARSAAAPSSRRTKRSLWGNGHGNFTTVGKYAAASVLGTKWLTTDTCTTTRITVATGMVRVTDFVRHRRVVLRAPHSYLAGH
jgi:hypothetical protein